MLLSLEQSLPGNQGTVNKDVLAIRTNVYFSVLR